MDLANKNIILGICGGIAAYKTTYLIRDLLNLGAKVKVVMTESAKEFVTPVTLQALTGEAVRDSLFDLDAERVMGHIELARWADYVLIVPTSANFIAKMAHGMADDLLSTLCLVTTAKLLLCPAMNHSMWSHPAVVANCEILKQRGISFVTPESGALACMEVGAGRLAANHSIINNLRFLDEEDTKMLPFKERHVIITAGPTQENLDPVRYLTNRSSGKMGYALAEAALYLGAKVTLVSGPTNLSPPSGLEFLQVRSAAEMLEAVQTKLNHGAIFIASAAVCDYYIQQISAHKLTKTETLHLSLSQTPDILSIVAAQNVAALVVGFAAQTEDLETQAKAKLAAKNLDLIVANLVGHDLGFDVDENSVSVFAKNNAAWHLPKMHKGRLAFRIMTIIAGLL
jgi:phosphopantothenoylcysteine decarboxylase / phosphopantothenate---cysteine ligase